MSFLLRYEPPPAPPSATAGDLEDALYALAEAGATAAVELDGYQLPLHGTGVVELHRQCRRLLDVLATGRAAPGDELLRAELPGVPDGAVLHSWIFSSYMVELPVIVFAIAGATTAIYTRTRGEGEGWPLVVLDGRDLPDPVEVPTAEAEAQARAFLDECADDARRLL